MTGSQTTGFVVAQKRRTIKIPSCSGNCHIDSTVRRPPRCDAEFESRVEVSEKFVDRAFRWYGLTTSSSNPPPVPHIEDLVGCCRQLRYLAIFLTM